MSVEDGVVITGLVNDRPGYVRLVEIMSCYIWLWQFERD
jgi:hypothetical protein